MNTDQINDLYWWAQERVQGFMSGLHRSPDFGYSVEFAQHRQYVPGDSPKHIDWSVYAKTDRFLTKLYEAESNMRTFFVLDSSSSMFYPKEDSGKWERTVQVIKFCKKKSGNYNNTKKLALIFTNQLFISNEGYKNTYFGHIISPILG